MMPFAFIIADSPTNTSEAGQSLKTRSDNNKGEAIMLRWVTFVFSLAMLVSPSAQGSTISYLGTDSTTADGWRSTGVTKAAAYDPNGDNVYGNDGYYIAYGTSTTGGSGTIANNVMSSLPSYVSSIAAPVTDLKNGLFVAGSYGALDDPSAGTASTVSNLKETGLWDANGTTAYFTITLNSNAAFVLGVIVGTHDSTANYKAGSVLVSGSNGDSSGTIDVSSYTVTRLRADYVFFEINGTAGETITVTLTPTAGAGYATTSGLTFETVVPEPSTVVLGLAGAASLLAYAWRKRRRN
jgi:hypothetical protein